MKAYEFPAKVTPDGKLELPDMRLEDLPNNSVVRVIVLIEEPSDVEIDEDEQKEDEEDIESAVESFRRSWYEAQTGQRIPLSKLWEGIETDAG
jgi:hypothetical protein